MVSKAVLLSSSDIFPEHTMLPEGKSNIEYDESWYSSQGPIDGS